MVELLGRFEGKQNRLRLERVGGLRETREETSKRRRRILQKFRQNLDDESVFFLAGF